MAGRRPTQTTLDFLWGSADAQAETVDHERVRAPSDEALATLAAEAVQPAGGPGDVLRAARGGSEPAGERPEQRPRGDRAAGGELPGQSGSAEHGTPDRGLGGDARTGADRPGAGRRPGGVG